MRNYFFFGIIFDIVYCKLQLLKNIYCYTKKSIQIFGLILQRM